MTNGKRIVIACILCLAQIILSNYLYVSHYLVLNLLPLVILSLPASRGVNVAMLVAFLAGFAVDFASTGILGLSSAALLPVALLRFPILRAVGGEEYLVHRDRWVISLRAECFSQPFQPLRYSSCAMCS